MMTRPEAEEIYVQHWPHRGSDVEAWIKTMRNGFRERSLQWRAVDDLLDDYRTRADYGLSLTSHVEGHW